MKNTLTNQTFLVTDNRYRTDNWRKDKYTKFLVTIALRLGIALDDNGADIDLIFSGKFSEHNNYHESDNYIGTLTINNKYTVENVKICTRKNNSRIETLWPIHDDYDKNEQAKNNSTSDFIEYYINGERLFTIDDIATYYFPVFLEKPGLEPIALEKEVCARKEEALRMLYTKKTSELASENKSLKDAFDSQIKQNTEENNTKLETDVTNLIQPAEHGITVTSRSRKILKNVTLEPMSTQRRGTVEGVVLHFNDGTTLSNNWSNGPDRKKIIDKLIGREVVTDVWGSYSDSKWFANVYLK
jgi:hypothetical protein